MIFLFKNRRRWWRKLWYIIEEGEFLIGCAYWWGGTICTTTVFPIKMLSSYYYYFVAAAIAMTVLTIPSSPCCIRWFFIVVVVLVVVVVVVAIMIWRCRWLKKSTRSNSSNSNRRMMEQRNKSKRNAHCTVVSFLARQEIFLLQLEMSGDCWFLSTVLMFAAASMLLFSLSLSFSLQRFVMFFFFKLLAIKKEISSRGPSVFYRVKTSFTRKLKTHQRSHQRHINYYWFYSLSTHFDIINDQLVPKEEVKRSNTSIRSN